MRKMNINRASDLNSISVFPPRARSSRAVASEPQASQIRSQHSQQSFSQGPSSQRGSFSQLTQSSLDEAMATDQRLSSQERSISIRKVNCLPPINHQRDESQMQVSLASSNTIRKWGSSSIQEKCQVGEVLEQRIGMTENSLSRIGMILDSLQIDVMQVNKGTKELLMETERIRQKLILHDTTLQLLNKEQLHIKSSVEEGIKSLSDELSKGPHKELLEKILVSISAIPDQIETSLRKLQNELCSIFTREIQALGSVKVPEPKLQAATMLPAKVTANLQVSDHRGPMNNFSAGKVTANLQVSDHRGPMNTFSAGKSMSTTSKSQITQQHPWNPAKTLVNSLKPLPSPKLEVGGWKSVKPIERNTYKKRAPNKQVKWEEASPVGQGRECRVIIDSDEEIEGFSCLLVDNAKGVPNNFKWEAEKETKRILQRARRSKRKYDNPIIIN